MSSFDPTDIEFAEVIRSEKIERDNNRVRLINFVLLLFIALAFILTSDRIPIIPEMKRILLPFLSILFPVLIARSYPRSTQSIWKKRKPNFIYQRLSVSGVPALILILNVVYFKMFYWNESLYCAIIACYALTAIIAFRPVFASSVKSPSNWTHHETILKIATLTVVVFVLGKLYGNFPFQNALFSENKNLMNSILAITVLIPFYIGIAISRLPDARSTRTHTINKSVLLEKFGK